MKSFLFVLLFVAAGCGGGYHEMITYRPAGSAESPWRVAATRIRDWDRVEVVINDSVVCTANIGIMGKSDEAKGEYRGHKVIANLQKTEGLSGEGLRCVVTIDGAMAGKFEW
ncbi:MAG TPA: hypothetical protein VI215_13140 [Bacteroidota bacterium]|jgi:hypothetical protein